MRILAVIIAISLIAFFGLSYYAGIFDKLDASLSAAGPFNLVYREHTGPSRGVRAAQNDVFRFLSEKRSVVSRKAFAEYFYNPGKTKAEELRSIGGYITDSLMSGVPAPFVAEIFPQTLSIVGVFPLRSFMSIMTGPMKFYPKMAEILIKQKREAGREARGPVMEIDDVPAGKIVYIAPLK